jgi:hypothetical protein
MSAFARAADDLAGAGTAGGRAVLGDAAPLVARSAGDAAATAASASRAAANAGQDAAGVMARMTGDGAQGVVRSIDEVADVVDSGIIKALDENPGSAAAMAEKNALKNAPNPTGEAVDAINIKFSFPSGKTLLGLAVTAYCIYALASLFDTDGQTIDIIKMTPISDTQVQIDYTPPAGKLAFALRIGDTLTFSGCTTGCINPGLGTEQVVKLNGDTSCIINKRITSIAGVPYPPPAPSPSGTASGPASTPVPTPSGSTYWGTALVASSLTNQFVGSIADMTATVFASLGAAVGSALVGGVSGLGQGLGIPPSSGGDGPLCGIPLVGGILCGGGGGGGGGGLCSLPIISSFCGIGQTLKTIIFIICCIISLGISAYIAYKIASG